MIKNKEDLIPMLQKLKENDIDFYEHIKYENQVANKTCILINCINRECPNYGKIDFDGMIWHLCYDDYSLSKNGWHEIYGETIDVCTDRFE